MPEYVSEPGGHAALKEKQSVKVPRHFKVLLHNDHYTTMEFVILVLMELFHKSESQATQIMLQIHENEMGVAGVYIKAIAETKAAMVHKLAHENGYPLKSSIEAE